MINNINDIFHAIGFIFVLAVFLGYCLSSCFFVHLKNSISTQVSMLTVLPVSLLAFYLLNLPLFALLNDMSVGEHGVHSHWYRLGAIGVISSAIVAAAMQERAFIFSSCVMAICVGLLATFAYAMAMNPASWLVRTVGYRDAFAAGPLHSVAGGFAFGVIMVLGARLSRSETFKPQQKIPANFTALALLGLTLICLGMLGFKLLFIGFNESFELANVYGQFVSVSTLMSNNVLAFAVGSLTIILLSRNNFYCALCGGLAAMSSIAAGADIYTTQQSILVSIIVVSAAFITSRWLLSRGIDDLISAVFIHGLAGFYGLIVSGFLLSGQVVHVNIDSVVVSVLGQSLAAAIMFIALGFIPGFAIAWLLRWFDILRLPRRMEILGIDTHHHYQNKADLSDCIDIDLAAVEAERTREMREEAIKL